MVDLIEIFSPAGKQERLFVAKSQKTERTKAFIKKVDDFVLKFLIKINENIPANDQLEFIEGSVYC